LPASRGEETGVSQNVKGELSDEAYLSFQLGRDTRG